MNKKNLAAAVILYFASTAVSFATFRYIGSEPIIQSSLPVVNAEGGLAIDPSEPKTEACPLNGQKFTKTEKNVWEQRRPLLVMIENHVESRPQSGLSSSDIVYEAVAEGGITRFMAVFYCDAVSNDTLLAPVRSARTYFLDWASEYSQNPLYVHVGGANCSLDEGTGRCKSDKRVQALEQIQSYGWGGRNGNDMNQFSIGFPTFYRDAARLDRNVATEHTMVSSTEKLWDLAKQRGWTNKGPKGEEWTESYDSWSFDDDAGEGQRGSTSTIAHDFWEGFKQFDVRWEYDSTTNSYNRFLGGEAHKDLETDSQINVKNVVVQFVDEVGPVDELKHMLYQTTGQGQALIFNNGNVTEARWRKNKRTDRTIFTDRTGKEIKFVRGRIWLSIVADDNEVSY